MWTQLDSGRVTHRFEPVVLAVTLALIPVMVIEAEATSSRWKDFAVAANWLIWLVFAVEFAFILAVAPWKGAFCSGSARSRAGPPSVSRRSSPCLSS